VSDQVKWAVSSLLKTPAVTKVLGVTLYYEAKIPIPA